MGTPVKTASRLNVDAVTEWLATAGLMGYDVDALLEEFSQRLVQAGMPLMRSHVAFNTLHPQFRAFSHTWRRGEGLVNTFAVEHEQAEQDEWLRSPFHYMLSKDEHRLRRRLVGAGAKLDFPVLEEFKAQGATDWFGLAIPFGWQGTHNMTEKQVGLVSSWASDAPGGFSDDHIRVLIELVPFLALAVKATTTYQMARSILITYLGRDAGSRVMSGRIQRGSVESMPAVLLLSDLRGFTRLADTTPVDDIVAMLDDYLELMCEPVHRRGGQALKFLGDGLLATFDLRDSVEADVCRTALDAAEEILRAVRAYNKLRQAAGKPFMDLDLALHMGEVLYGNVGSSERLEFTIIGPAVNETARIEAMCQNLDTNLLISDAFARSATHCGARLKSVGVHPLRGVQREQELFTLLSG
jgi:adenylate cyclase